MNRTIAVDCVFDQEGRIRVRRVQMDDEWLVVEQGRQWRDEIGRHILLIIPGLAVQEIVLSPDSLRWQLLPRPAGLTVV